MLAQITGSTPKEREPPDSKTCWALLERVVASPRFQRAARLREFLLYVGRRSLEEGCDQIHEQEIGSEVFGRPVAYDTSVDNIVRVNATELRKRIEAYFEAEGANEALVLDLPRGSYKPVFRNRPIQPSATGPQIAENIDLSIAPVPELAAPFSQKRLASDRILLLLAVAVIGLLAVASASLWMQNRAMHQSLYAWQSTPSVGSFWSGILDARPNTDVILADTSFALIEDITKKPITLNDYLSRTYISQLQSQDMSQDRRDDLGLIVQRNYGSLGDFRVTQRILALDPLGKNIHLYYARDYSPASVKQDNLVLIGSRKSNPWVDLFEGSLNFTVEYDPNRFLSLIRNRVPAPGEEAIYTSPHTPDSNTGYSVVAYLPNPNQDGKVLIIAGTDSEATEGAGEFVTSEEQLADFQKLLHVTKLPYFEVLLRTTHLNGTPLDAKIVAYRTYPSQHSIK